MSFSSCCSQLSPLELFYSNSLITEKSDFIVSNSKPKRHCFYFPKTQPRQHIWLFIYYFLNTWLLTLLPQIWRWLHAKIGESDDTFKIKFISSSSPIKPLPFLLFLQVQKNYCLSQLAKPSPNFTMKKRFLNKYLVIKEKLVVKLETEDGGANITEKIS